MKKVAVLLSAYNGAEYIEEQIRSICQQSYPECHLYVRDDGSDRTFVGQLKELQKQYAFTLLEGENIGFVASFMTLLQQVTDADLYAFADQDDIWLPDKIQKAVTWFDTCEDSRKPLLYHSAYDVVDGEGKVVDHFYFGEEGYDFRRSITENHYSGFSMVVNAAMREYMLKGQWNQIGYHDWWAAMIVHAFGMSYSDSEVLALHRAHGDNVTTFNMRTRIQWLHRTLTEESELRKRAVEFERCFGEQLSKPDKKILRLFTDKHYNILHACKKCFYPKRWRPILSSEIVVRVLMLIGRM